MFAQEASCSDCHNDTTLITGKATAWATSGHGTGTAYGRGTSSGCAGCHSGGGFSAMVAAGQTPDTVDAGDPNPTRQSCRACHQTHTNYSGADWALETTAPVTLLAFDDVTFEGGKGNLCVNCHQPRRTIAAPDADGMINVSSTHWGPHHGPQSAMLLGIGGTSAEGEPVVGLHPAAEASALWDYIFIAHEDGSLGVHNAEYTKALLEAAKAALQ